MPNLQRPSSGAENRLIILYCGVCKPGYLVWGIILGTFPDGRSTSRSVSALNECPYLDSEQRKDVEIGILDGESDACIALLVTLLPDLRSIETCGFSENHCFRVMVPNIGHVSLEHCHRIRFGYGNQAKTQTVDALCKL